MGTTSNAIFTGSSQFSQDFQNVITRAVNIASLPITQLTNQKNDLSNQSTALSTLDAAFTALQSAVSGISNSFGGSGLQASVSDNTKLSVSLGSGATEGTYSIDIADPGSYASSITASNWDSSADHVYQISLNGQSLDLTVTDNSAQGVADAINAQYGGQVRATVVNVGGSDTNADYRISLQGVQLGDLDPQILCDGTSIQDPSSQIAGTQALYTIDNSNNTVTGNSRTVSIAPGVTLNLLGGRGMVTVTVSRPASALSSALSSFVNAYNGAVDALAKQRGQSGGALAGNAIVQQLSQALETIGTFGIQGGAVSGLRALGLDLGSDGHFTLDQSAFTTFYNQDSESVASFFGSADSGFIQSANSALDLAQNSDSGLLPLAEASVKTQSDSIDSQISTQQDRVDQLQQSLQQQMAAADSLIASMEQQYSYISSMFQAMQVADQQYKG